MDLDAPARLGVEAAVRRVRQRHHEGRPDQAVHLPEQAGRPDALVPRPRRAPHRRERLHGPGRAVPPARRRREGPEHPEVGVRPPDVHHGRRRPAVRPAARPGGQDVQRERRVPVRRRGPHRPVGRRRPGQRGAVAEPQGLQAQVPLPGAQRVDLPRLPVADEQQRTDQRDRYGRRPDAAGAGHHAAADRHGRALRDRHRLLEVHHGHQGPAAQPGRAQLHGLRQHRQDHAVPGRGHAGRCAGRRDAAQRRPLLPEPEQGGLGPQGERHPGHDEDRGRPPERRVEDPEHVDQHHEQLGVGQLRRLGVGRFGLGQRRLGVGQQRLRQPAAPRSS